MPPILSPCIGDDKPLYQIAQYRDTAYTKLAEYQGSVVPYCFGPHQVNIQNSTEAYLLALEYIPHSYYWLQEKIQSESDFMTLEEYQCIFLQAFHALTTARDLGFHHGSPTAEHLMVANTTCNHQVVIIDRKYTHHGKNLVKDPETVLMEADVYSLVESFLHCPRFREGLYDWVKNTAEVKERLDKCGGLRRLILLFATVLATSLFILNLVSLPPLLEARIDTWTRRSRVDFGRKDGSITVPIYVLRTTLILCDDTICHDARIT
ncbi:serine threonine sps1 [Moniliophthora roreri MCA 2997]|uniref:Serine threonine sps1 n=2 Tax=Moniliophthora roreri TaxID=221103 RepID=V2XQZ1_MONRO|nr:serine threonine sps1 [Moniliophthora roreri MCA 2997]KAI3616082.1 serine threonine sps1 [Moniliophthora roreri]